MIAIQTSAMLKDAYRELNARKMFWITMVISGLVVGVFAMLGLGERGVKFLTWEFPSPLNTKVMEPATFYKYIFVNLGISFWLAWVASILALISTASIFPDFVAGGSVELSLSKPIGRARLFLTKYFVGLLFVALQVTVFTLASFLVIGLRGGDWVLGLFWSVPLVVVFFSYLFCVCALVGLLTRSAIASLLLTVLFWLMLFGVNTTEAVLVSLREQANLKQESLTKQITRMETGTRRRLMQQAASAAAVPSAGEGEGESETAEATTPAAPTTPPAPKEPTIAEIDAANPVLVARRAKLVEVSQDVKDWNWWTKTIRLVKTPLPKTQETVALLSRKLISDAELDKFRGPGQVDVEIEDDKEAPVDRREFRRRMEQVERERSAAWILGTSLGFEVIVLGVAVLIFRRRDF